MRLVPGIGGARLLGLLDSPSVDGLHNRGLRLLLPGMCTIPCGENGGEMATITLNVNGRKQPVDVAPETPLLWVLRETLGMTGTKFGCGRGLCGSCTVHIDGEATRSCVTPVGSVEEKKITTIERLSPVRIHPLQ